MFWPIYGGYFSRSTSVEHNTSNLGEHLKEDALIVTVKG
jgi:hypothetical protein